MRYAPMLATLVRCSIASLAVLATCDNLATAQSAADEWSPVRPGSEVAERGPRAILIRNAEADAGAPPYALVDQFGRIQRYVEPTPGVNLEEHIGQQVRVAHDTGRTLLATQLDLPDELRQLAPRGEARPARFVPPQRLARMGQHRSSRSGRVRPAQFTGESSPDAEPIDLDDVIARERDSVDSLPSPDESREQLEPTAAEPYYTDTDSYVSDEGPHAAGVHTGEVVHADDCPHCQKRYRAKIVESPQADCDCPQCRTPHKPLASTTCQQCGGGGWCGPTCNPPSRRGFYGRAEYLIWWFDEMNTPPLVSRNTDPARPDFDTAGTQTIYGGELLDDARNGLRFTAGFWLDNERDFAIEGDWLFFETESDFFSAGDPAGGGTVTIGRPFYDIAPVIGSVPTQPQENVQLITLPGTVGGVVNVSARSEFESAGLRLRTGICCREIGGCGSSCNSCGPPLKVRRGGATAVSRVDFIGGYRYASLDESLGFNETTTLLSTSQSLTLNESFSTENDFHGVDLGFIYEWESRRWGVELVSKIAVGVTDQQVRIAGATVSEGVTTSGGLLAQSTNIGSYSRDQFSVMPELSARLAYRITPRLRASVAYSLLYWSNVVRPGDQIDYSVDSRAIPPAVGDADSYRHPHFAFNDTSIWAHGFNFGLDYQY